MIITSSINCTEKEGVIEKEITLKISGVNKTYNRIAKKIISHGNHEAVIFQFSSAGSDVLTDGTKNFSDSFVINSSKETYRVFYLNNNGNINDAVKMFEGLLCDYGLDDRIPVGSFRSSRKTEIWTPEEAGNGGVVTCP